MAYTFVLKDKGTFNAGWWLKISTADELIDYMEQKNPILYGKALENYMYGKEFHENSKASSPNPEEIPITKAIIVSAKKQQTFLQACDSFSRDVAIQQLETIQEYGCIFINKRGGYHADYDGEHEYDTVVRKNLVFPCFKRDEIEVKPSKDGTCFYAFIDGMEVQDIGVKQWGTYDEAYQKALLYVTD